MHILNIQTISVGYNDKKKEWSNPTLCKLRYNELAMKSVHFSTVRMNRNRPNVKFRKDTSLKLARHTHPFIQHDHKQASTFRYTQHTQISFQWYKNPLYLCSIMFDVSNMDSLMTKRSMIDTLFFLRRLYIYSHWVLLTSWPF